MIVVKCLDCRNTFKTDGTDGDLVVCPICEADYKLIIKDGKATLEEFNYDKDDDVGEL
jgi:Zn finger protein HypA/HybF involved in hydrogenase expression